MRWFLLIPGILFLLLLGPALTLATGVVRWHGDWRTASREPAGLAPNPARTPEAVVQVYAARALGWRGAFGVHCWIAVKPKGAPEFTVYEVIGWRHYRGLPALAVSNRAADGRWFGAMPELLADARGALAEGLIPRIETAVRDYPYPDSYRVWPGPNSNTFVAHVLREVPELGVDLPPTAIGKDYLGAHVVARSPSGSGWQVSLLGVVGILAARNEGLELNLLGMTFGLDPDDLAVKVPGFGRLALRPGRTTVTPES